MMLGGFHRSCPMIALCIFLLITTVAHASYVKIAGYEPGSDVEQHSFIDLDQQELETHLSTNPPDFTSARLIYTLGANSGGYAELSVAALAADVAEGAAVAQTLNAGATGYVKSSALAGATTLKVTYTSQCKMGGSSSPDTQGCFTTSGALSVNGVAIGSASTVSNKYRTLAGFSSAAQSKMAGQEFYTVYRAYYSEGDYANQFVLAALDGTGIFTGKDEISRVEGAKKGSAYQSVWMYVIREMEDAIMDCTNGCLNCNDDPVHAWDEAVAFYAGSLEGPAGDSSGNLLYRLAEKRCGNFGTCSSSGSMSDVNTQIIWQFRLGQYALTQGKCVEAVPIKRRIVELMSVPLVQGSLRYAFKIDQLKGGSKEKAEGAAFAAAILPRVAACNSEAAKLISENMAMDASSPLESGFASVKQAFESTYACMGITCADVGGLILSGKTYYTMAEPCTIPSTATGDAQTKEVEVESTPVWLVVLLVVIAVAFLSMSVAAFILCRQARKYQKLAGDKSQGQKADVVGQPQVSELDAGTI